MRYCCTKLAASFPCQFVTETCEERVKQSSRINQQLTEALYQILGGSDGVSQLFYYTVLLCRSCQARKDLVTMDEDDDD